MDTKNTSDNSAKEPRWVKAEDGSRVVYVNMACPSWTRFDVSIAVGQLVPIIVGDPSSEYEVKQQAVIAMSWAAAKGFRDMLSRLIDNYESVNGEIKTPTLPVANAAEPRAEAATYPN